MKQPASVAGLVNIDGNIAPISEGRIPVLDHGFLFGDSIYETLRTYNQKPFLFSRHFERLRRSARAVFLDLPWSREETYAEVLRTIQQAGAATEHRVRITVTRGAGDVSPDPASCGSPSVIIFATPLRQLPAGVYADGVEVIISSFYRSRQLGDAKTGNLLRSVLAQREARAAGAFEAITLTSEGKISDGITSNICLIQDNRLLTPSTASGILEGITRAVVLDLARRAGLTVIEDLLDLSEIEKSSELFLTSSTRGVVPIVRVSGKPVGTGKPGPATRQLMDAYRQEVDLLLKED
jgi:branched-chain amino acid aminotransferase